MASKTYRWFPTNIFDLSSCGLDALDSSEQGQYIGGVSLAVILDFSVNYFDILTSLGWAAEKSSHRKVLLIGDYASLDDTLITHSVS